MTIEIMGGYAFQQCNSRLVYFSNAIKKNQVLIIDK